MKKLILGLVVCAAMAAPALANITILGQYPGAPYTDTLYDFKTATQQGGHISSHYDYWETNFAPGGVPTNAEVDVTGFLAGWYQSPLPEHIQGQTVAIEFTIPNMYYPPYYKLVQVEIVYKLRDYSIDGGLDDYLIKEAPGAQIISVERYPVVRGNLGEWQDVTFTWKIWPQPEYEKIWLYLTGGHSASGTALPIWVDSVEVATVCIPAPGAILLSGIGVALVGWMRRRRCL